MQRINFAFRGYVMSGGSNIENTSPKGYLAWLKRYQLAAKFIIIRDLP